MRGLNVPSFYKNMTFKEKVSLLLTEALSEKQSLFLIDLTITDAFKVIVTLDDDNGVVLQDCIDISRVIENNLDVASAGVSSPLKHIRQYKKNIGRTLIVKTTTENIEAELVEANDDFVILSWKAREPKKIGKGKETVQKTLEVPYGEIKEAIVTVTF
jgi:ribosome maturation factor RimP